MTYDKIAGAMHLSIFKENCINNNYLRFRFLNCEKKFYNLAKNYYDIIGEKIVKDIIELCVLFEYLYL